MMKLLMMFPENVNYWKNSGVVQVCISLGRRWAYVPLWVP